MNIYKCKKTGVIVRTECTVKGEDWEDITPKAEPKKAKKKEK